jgi:protein-glutamine gamma-glutamyltransferase
VSTLVNRLQLHAPLVWTATATSAAVALHAGDLPFWILASFALLVVWRALLGLRGASLPSRPLRYAAVFAVTLGVLATFRTLNGLEAGTAMLSLMAGLKLLETRTPRDHVVLVLISYILVLAAFLRDQSLPLLPVYAAIVWFITTALLRATQRPDVLTARESAGYAARMLVQALPLMILLFLFYPRVPGPYWFAQAGDRAVTGLSDEMSPGDISELSLQSTVAFRVRFDGEVPPPAQRYWRGPVLHDFDGYTWARLRGVFQSRVEPRFEGPSYGYQMMLEPSARNWVFALDLPVSWDRTSLAQTSDYQLVARDMLDPSRTVRLDGTRSLRLESRPRFRFEGELPLTVRRRAVRLPAGSNPRSVALGQRMRAEAADDESFARSVLQMFRDQEFFYTLTPPGLELDSVDDFLFNTRQGFCGHFASAFTALMRAGGVPARVVTGYQGGELNRFSGYYIVRQSDAHAWSEIWLQGRGWTRMDPTAFVAPERIERGLLSALAEDEPVADRFLREWPLLGDVRFAWDMLNTVWRERVVEFNSAAQFSLLEWLGVRQPDWRALTLLLVASLVVVMGLIALHLRRAMLGAPADPVRREYDRFCRRLSRHGVLRHDHEGPLDFARRVAEQRPAFAQVTDAVTASYVQLRYERAASGASLRELRRLVRSFR